MEIGVIFIFAAIISIAFYFLPIIIAAIRGHNNCLSIFILNLLLGWTFVGWVVALVWACANVQVNRQ